MEGLVTVQAKGVALTCFAVIEAVSDNRHTISDCHLSLKGVFAVASRLARNGSQQSLSVDASENR